ncbi:hypothetical protein L6R53_23590 [Myxococcota bacterium]|nr:hypothetical protein [Myxococcota bacterium]
MEANEQREWLVFLCYRRADGDVYAEALYKALNGKPLPAAPPGYDVPPVVTVFWDQSAPAGDDWHKVHEPFLSGAHCMIYIATPGAVVPNPDGRDWVDKELGSWLATRSTALSRPTPTAH